MFRPAFIAFTLLVLSVVFLNSGCNIYRDMYSPRRSYFVPSKATPAPVPATPATTAQPAAPVTPPVPATPALPQ